jgi:hypothetical protein
VGKTFCSHVICMPLPQRCLSKYICVRRSLFCALGRFSRLLLSFPLACSWQKRPGLARRNHWLPYSMYNTTALYIFNLFFPILV